MILSRKFIRKDIPQMFCDKIMEFKLWQNMGPTKCPEPLQNIRI